MNAMFENLSFTKIKYSHSTGDTTLAFTAQTGDWTPDEYRIKTHDRPTDDFFRALQGLRPHLLTVMGLPMQYGQDLTVIGVTIKTGTQYNKVVVTAIKAVRGRTAVLNSPLAEVGAATQAALDVLRDEATQLLDGKRARADLFDDTEDEPPTPAELARQAAQNTN